MGALSNPAFMAIVTGIAAMVGFLMGLAVKQREVDTLRMTIADIRRETEATVRKFRWRSYRNGGADGEA